jgi:uncharacterized Ntn-hydrolase superfamily protein
LTYSIVARCSQTGMFGVAVASPSPAVAARCAYAEARVGAVASQNVTDPTLGPRTLALLADGATAPEALAILKETHAHMDHRQLLAVDADGRSAVHSGPGALGIWAEANARDVACAGNLLENPGVPKAMVRAFERSEGDLGDRLVAVMRAARDAGGEAGPVHSAGLKLVREVAWPVADLRVDWTEDDPIEGLAQLWRLYKPQLESYVTRALDPTAAPRFDVPGDR